MGMLINPYATAPVITGFVNASTAQNFSAASGTINLPTYVAGDIVFIEVVGVNTSSTFDSTPPTGWDLAAQRQINSLQSVVVYSKRMDGTEGSTVSVTWNGASGSRNVQVTTSSWRGAVAAGAYTEASTGTGSSTTTVGTRNLTSAAVTTLGNNRIVLNFMDTARGVDNTLAEGADTWADAYLNATSLASVIHIQSSLSYLLAPTSGAQGTEMRTAQYASGGSLNWTYVCLALIMA